MDAEKAPDDNQVVGMASHEQEIDEHEPTAAMPTEDSIGGTSTHCSVQNTIHSLIQAVDDDE